MFRLRKYISLLLVFTLVFMVVPRRADAVIPGIAAAAAALGCSEGTLVAVGGGLLAAGGIIANGENEKVKAVSAAVAGLGSAALERLSAAVNAVGPGGQFTLPIDQYLAQDIADMVQNVNDVAESGEGIETKFAGPETMLHPVFGQSLSGGAGILSAWYEWYGNTYYGDSLFLSVKRVNSSEITGIEIHAGYHMYEPKGYTMQYRIKTSGYYVGEWIDIYTNLNGGSSSVVVGEGTVSVIVDEENSYAFVDGELVYTWEGCGESLGYGIDWINANGNALTSIVYSIDAFGEDYLTPGVDYTDAQLTPEQIAALAGTTITGDVVTNVYNPPVINPPVTWPEATDLTGIMGALQNLWNTIVQGFNAVKAYLAQIVASISTPMDPNVLLEPINNLKGFILGKVPELADLDMSGFAEREWDWTVSVSYPFAISFEVLDSEMLERARPTIKGFTSGILILLTTIYAYKRIPEIVNR